jgi:hypothetical protein
MIATGAVGSTGSKVATNAIDDKPLDEGLGTALVAGALGAGISTGVSAGA